MAAAGSEGGSREDKKAAAQAFTDRLNATPASGSEADRFRAADDTLKGLEDKAIQALSCFADGAPPEVVATMECWCLLHDVKPMSVEGCLELSRDTAEFKLVGMSTLNYLNAEEISSLEQRAEGLELAALKATAGAGTQAAAAMLEWLQAALAMRRWALEARKASGD
eukprot:TRINITY_DN114678_c0_g1_i1.p1 TRINITY_DN114678_c0_g1~~TRINITY_DN114678_c0_g1_i1.p1  ORF type:complete len:176 (-),score=61.71 TRINITY_DN114678_c0_g1_i1:10-510(-)